MVIRPLCGINILVHVGRRCFQFATPMLVRVMTDGAITRESMLKLLIGNQVSVGYFGIFVAVFVLLFHPLVEYGGSARFDFGAYFLRLEG